MSTMPVGSGLLSLPPELLEDIIELLGPRQIFACQPTCRTFRDIIQNSTRIQYQVALFSACKVDGSRNDLTLAHRLDTLRRREQAWTEPQWRDRLQVKLPTDLRIDFSDMILSNGVLLVHNDLSTEIAHFAWGKLPSVDDHQRSELVEWHHLRINVDFHLCGVYADTEQDLLVYLECFHDPTTASHGLKIRLRTLSRNSPHPEALHATIMLALPIDWNIGLQPAIMKVYGTHVGILFSPPMVQNQDYFFLYDWKKAVRKDCSFLPSTFQRRWDSIAFLSENHVLLPNKAGECLDLYTFTSEPKSLRHTASFGLPAFDGMSDWYLGDICVSPDNSQIPIPLESRIGRSSHGPIYQHDLKESIVVIILDCFRDGEREFGEQTWAVSTHVTSLVSYSDQETGTLGSAAIYIPWLSWGIRSAAFICGISVPFALPVPCVQGTRFGLLKWQSQRYPSLTLFNFNRRCLRVDSEIGFCNMGDGTYGPRCDNDDTNLPFRTVSIGPLEGWESFLMDDERIIGILEGRETLDILLM